MKNNLKPQEKYNLKINATDFRAATNTGWEKQLLGEDIYIIEIKIPFKYLYIPPCLFDIYLHSTKYVNLMKIPQNVFIPIDIIDKIILVKPTDMTSVYVFFQYWLLNEKSAKILDVYEEINFTLVKGVSQSYFMPFPTYQIKLCLKIPTNPTSIDFRINIRTISEEYTFTLDELNGMTEKLINNVYKYDFVGGSGQITNPHYPFPSCLTQILLKNNDVGNDIIKCYLSVISWED